MDKESVLLDSEDRMDKALGALDRDFSRLRTGRASTGLVDNIKVDYYGTPTPISQLASARKSGEEAKVAVRNVRRDANDQLKKLEKDKAISEDELKKATDDVQKLTDKYVAKVDEKCAAKEKEIMDL